MYTRLTEVQRTVITNISKIDVPGFSPLSYNHYQKGMGKKIHKFKGNGYYGALHLNTIIEYIATNSPVRCTCKRRVASTWVLKARIDLSPPDSSPDHKPIRHFILQ